jgi:hypothetical protein
VSKIVYTAFVAFCASVLTLVAVDAVSPPPAGQSGAVELPVFSLDDVARHGDAESCWMAIEGRVYDFTDYIPEHPTRPSVVLRWCGREATEGMRRKGRLGRDHSPAAWAAMEAYLIGRVSES